MRVKHWKILAVSRIWKTRQACMERVKEERVEERKGGRALDVLWIARCCRHGQVGDIQIALPCSLALTGDGKASGVDGVDKEVR